jgi:predicted permease
METLGRDIVYALRQLRKSPGFTITAVVTLALGIGANTAIFTLVHGILLRSLPVADPGRIYRIGDLTDCCYYDRFENDNGDFDLFSYDLYLRMRQAAPEFEQLAAVEAGGGSGYTVRRAAEPAKSLRGEYVSGNYFSMLGVGAYAGRPLSEQDDRPEAAPAVVLSYAAFQSAFAGDPAVLGSTIYVKGYPFTVAGIAAAGFFGDRVAVQPPDFWMPLASEAAMSGANSSVKQVNMAWLYTIGRLRPGVSPVALQTRLSAVLRQWMQGVEAFTAQDGAARIPAQHVVLTPAGGGIQKMQKQTGAGLRMLMLVSSVVLLIACANIANLLLARGTARRAEISVRMALGAARSRLIRQILTESVLLSLVGGAAGLAVAYTGSRMILTLAFPAARNMPIEATPSLAVLGFAFLVSLVTGAVFGTAPAWLSSHAPPAEALRGAGSSGAQQDRTSLPQRALVVLQVALSVVLLAGAFLMSRSLANLQGQDFGFSTANRFVLGFDSDGAGYTAERLPVLYRAIEDRISALPGAAHVSLWRYVPMGGNNWDACVVPQGRPTPGPGDDCYATWDRASIRFLDSIGVPMVRGRDIMPEDSSSTRQVVIVNQAFARRFFPGQDPIGKRFGEDKTEFSGAYEIVGVFADFKMVNARGEAEPLFFRPMGQVYTGNAAPDAIASEKASLTLRWLIVAFTRPTPDAEAMIRRTLASIDPNLTVFHFASYDAEVGGNFNQERLIARLTSLFGLLALVLASVGLYGVMSYIVARRSGEIGIRMALGATRASVVTMVLRGALGQVLAGLLLGIPAALYGGHLIASQLYKVGSYDPEALAAATLLLSLCACAAGYIPARRAASIDPMRALRTE